MTRTIWKFTLPPRSFSAPEKIQIPRHAQVLSVQMQRGSIQLWMLVEPSQPTEERAFFVCGTGHSLPDEHAAYIGTVQVTDGYLVWHVFETTQVQQQQEA